MELVEWENGNRSIPCVLARELPLQTLGYLCVVPPVDVKHSDKVLVTSGPYECCQTVISATRG